MWPNHTLSLSRSAAISRIDGGPRVFGATDVPLVQSQSPKTPVPLPSPLYDQFSRARQSRRLAVVEPCVEADRRLQKSATKLSRGRSGQARRLMFFSTRTYRITALIACPCTSVRRKSRPLKRKVSRSWSRPRRCRMVACRSCMVQMFSTECMPSSSVAP